MIKRKINANIIIIIFVIALSIIVFQQYIIEGKLFLPRGVLSDILRVNLPTYYHMYDNLYEKTNFWSWSMGLGTSMFAHADIYCDPFTYIIFCGGRNYIPRMLIWSLIIKIIFEALAFSYYLSYFKLNRFAMIFASVLYSFSGYSLIMGGNLALGTILVYVPLVFRGIEVYIHSNKKGLLISSLFFVCIYSYYYFYIIGIMSVIYLILRYHKNRKYMFIKIVGLIAVGIVSICLSAFILFPQIQLALNSSRMNGGSDIEFEFGLFMPEMKTLATAFVRIFGNNLLGDAINSPYVGFAYDSNHDYFQTDLYLTSLLIPLLFQYLYYQNKYRKKVTFYIFLILCGTGLPIFSYIMNAFSTINYRWMFIIVFFSAVLVAFSIDTIAEEKEINISVYFFSLMFSAIGMFVSILILGNLGEVSSKDIVLNTWENGKPYVVVLIAVYFIFEIIILLLDSKMPQKVKKNIITFMATIIVIIDTSGNYYVWFGSENATCNYNVDDYCGYEDNSCAIIDELKRNDQGVYRINKNFDSVVDLNGIPSDNDAMAQQYYGLKSYCSVNNPNYISFLQELGIYVAVPIAVEYYKSAGMKPKDITGASLNYINGVGENYELMSFLGVKYLLIESEEFIDLDMLNYVGSTEGIGLYRNKAAYPFAFVNYNIMSKEEFNKLSDSEKVTALLYNTIIDESMIVKNNNYKSEKLDLILSAQKKQNDFKLLSFENDVWKFRIHVDENGQFLSFSMPYDEDWHVYIDNIEVPVYKINISLLGTRISEGEHIVVLKYRPKMLYIGIIVSIITGLLMIIYLIVRCHCQKAKD